MADKRNKIFGKMQCYFYHLTYMECLNSSIWIWIAFSFQSLHDTKIGTGGMYQETFLQLYRQPSSEKYASQRSQSQSSTQLNQQVESLQNPSLQSQTKISFSIRVESKAFTKTILPTNSGACQTNHTIPDSRDIQ